MISIILHAIVFCLIMAVMSLVICGPYFILKEMVRKFLWKLGFDCYLEQEKVEKGLIPENRIEKLKSYIAVQNEPPIDQQLDKLYGQLFKLPKKNSPKKIESPKVVIEDASYIEVKAIQKNPPKTTDDDILNQISNTLEDVNKKYK